MLISRLNSKSAKILEQYLRSNKTIHWGTVGDGVNGRAKKTASEQFQMMKEKGLEVPEWTRDIDVAREWVKEGLVFGRMEVHEGGRDIVGPKHPRWKRSELWVKVIEEPFDEWRIHVVGGKVIARQKKKQTGEAKRKMPVRNLKNGWTYHYREDPPKGMRKVAKQAVVAVGYDFGAVDIIHKGEKCVVLEVNKAPGIGGKFLGMAYGKALSDG